jgi:hypothetical protein
MRADERNQSAAYSPDHSNAPNSLGRAAQALRNGPIGAYVVSGIAVGLLFIAWLVFYFFLFMPRGSIG